jgi:hypothetical protein
VPRAPLYSDQGSPIDLRGDEPGTRFLRAFAAFMVLGLASWVLLVWVLVKLWGAIFADLWWMIVA